MWPAIIGFLPEADMTREGRHAPGKNLPTDIFTVRTENAPTPAVRKSQFSEVRVAGDTTSGSAASVAIPSYPSIQCNVLLRPGVNAAGCCAPDLTNE
jgi:hypothetical protein